MKNLIILSIAGFLLGGCTTGTSITKEGTTNDPKWHKVETILNKDQGTFPNLQSLSEVRQGMTKDQLYSLIGRPHYDDGWRPREWNYLFHFTTPGQGENDITTCQFKVIFDHNMIASSFYWNPINPKNGVCPPNIQHKQIANKRYTLSVDALFTFDKYDIENLNTKGKEDLDSLVTELGKFKELNTIQIIGYTDRLGTQDYNEKLSYNRAQTIKQYLTLKGIPSQIINTIAKGSEDAVKECQGISEKKQLIDCLAPNRRVIVDVDGYIEGTPENNPAIK
jgi:OmpA-OmpF porin, OOP family